MSQELKNTFGWIFAIVLIICIFSAIIAIPMSIVPRYNVWTKEMRGRADLAEAEFNRQITLKEAEMNLEAEKLNAKAEVERAKGMAEAIKIEGGQLTTEYIQYLWVRNMAGNNATVIYVPTETNLPILEATRKTE